MALVQAQSKLEASDLREIGEEAVWSLSSAKSGNGVEQLRDGNVESYWQSDGPNPHLINIQFHSRVSIAQVALYLDFKLDESYTPKKILVKSGTVYQDLVEIASVEVQDPVGWVIIPLHQDGISEMGVLTTHFVQICICSMHQNGRDTHVRQIKVFGPRVPVTRTHYLPDFQTVELLQFSCIR